MRFPGRVYYGDTHAVDVPSSGVVDEFREVAKGLSETGGCERGPQEGPSASECRFCPIGREDCPERGGP